ncbi:hypothetical protein EDB85DRAFT_2292683 [Lactarius pseudohatsudake]|nr:hypothetical protein EDB85DRAFT_2292683 [Lactarius pseudohatsudake]
MSSSEHISPPAPQRVTLLPSGPPLTSISSDRPGAKGQAKSNQSLPVDADLLVFDILNTFRRRWFLSRPNLLANAISAQKAEDGNISWVEFSPPYHSHLVKSAVALVPHPVHAVKKVMFVYILELLNGNGDLAFFDLHKGGRKANNAQKEKKRLARKRSRAAKHERDREAAKAAKLPPRPTASSLPHGAPAIVASPPSSVRRVVAIVACRVAIVVCRVAVDCRVVAVAVVVVAAAAAAIIAVVDVVVVGSLGVAAVVECPSCLAVALAAGAIAVVGGAAVGTLDLPPSCTLPTAAARAIKQDNVNDNDDNDDKISTSDDNTCDNDNYKTVSTTLSTQHNTTSATTTTAASKTIQPGLPFSATTTT